MDKSALKAAAILLIESDAYAKIVKELREIIAHWDVHPMAYDGHLACLNALLEIGLESEEKFERVLAFIEARRKAIPQTKRVDYQRTLMQERRARVAKALELHERTVGRIQSAAERQTLSLQIQKRWSAARAEYLKARARAQGRPLTWKARNEARAQFWASIDAKLDEGLKTKSKQPA